MSQVAKRGLGRGFEALLPTDFDTSILLTAADRIESVPVEQLQASPFQPRRNFDEQTLRELAASITNFGIVQPLVATPFKDGMYTLIAGERRWRAAQIAGLKTVPVLIRSAKELEQLELALIENVQRVDLDPLEQAISIVRLEEQFSLSHDDISKRLGKSTSTISNTIRLLNLPESAREALSKKQITEGHARTILALKKFPERQEYLLKIIIDQDWSVRQAERFVLSVKSGANTVKKVHERVNTQTPATRALTKKIGAPVAVRRMAKGGKLEITFKSDDELERLFKLLG